MMFAQIVVSMESVVALVVYLVIVAAVFGLLFWLTHYVEKQWSVAAVFMKFARVALVVCVVLVLIGLLLNFVGHPVLVLK